MSQWVTRSPIELFWTAKKQTIWYGMSSLSFSKPFTWGWLQQIVWISLKLPPSQPCVAWEGNWFWRKENFLFCKGFKKIVKVSEDQKPNCNEKLCPSAVLKRRCFSCKVWGQCPHAEGWLKVQRYFIAFTSLLKEKFTTRYEVFQWEEKEECHVGVQI